MLWFMCFFTKKVVLNQKQITVAYELPKLVSEQKMYTKISESQPNYFFALTSEQNLNNLDIQIHCQMRGASTYGGLVFQTRSLLIRLSTVSFINTGKNAQYHIAMICDDLMVIDSSILVNNNELMTPRAACSTFSNTLQKTHRIIRYGELSKGAESWQLCTECRDPQSKVEENCWACGSDQLIDNVEQRTCKCLYPNAYINPGNECVSAEIYSYVTQYNDNATMRGYALNCTSNFQANIKFSISSTYMSSFGVFKDDLCSPTNIYIKGKIDISYMQYYNFQTGMLTYKVQNGATEIHIAVELTNNAYFDAFGMLYAIAKNLNDSVVIENIYITGNIQVAPYGYGSQREEYPSGGMIGNVNYCKNLTMRGVYVYGLNVNISKIVGVGVVVGEFSNSNFTFDNIYVGPLQSSKQKYAIDPALANWSDVTLECKEKASTELQPSYYLQALAKQYDNGNSIGMHQKTGANSVGGLIGSLIGVIANITNVIVRYNISGNSQNNQYALFIGKIVSGAVTLRNAYAEGYLEGYNDLGGVAAIEGGTHVMTFAINFFSKGEYNGGAVGTITASSTLTLRTGINATFNVNNWYCGTVGRLENSVLNIQEAMGKITYEGGPPRYSGTVCGGIYNGTFNGDFLQNATSINEAPNCWVNNCG